MPAPGMVRFTHPAGPGQFVEIRAGAALGDFVENRVAGHGGYPPAPHSVTASAVTFMMPRAVTLLVST